MPIPEALLGLILSLPITVPESRSVNTMMLRKDLPALDLDLEALFMAHQPWWMLAVKTIIRSNYFANFVTLIA